MAESSAQADLNTPLQELAGASASFGQWTLKISGPPIEKTYPFDQGRKTGKAFTVVFVSKDSTQYCAGRFTFSYFPERCLAVENAGDDQKAFLLDVLRHLPRRPGVLSLRTIIDTSSSRVSRHI